MGWGSGAGRGLARGGAGRGRERLRPALGEDADRGARGPPLEAEGLLDGEHELEVERVAAVARDDVAEDGSAEQRQVADQIEDLVPDELVAVAEAVERAAVADDDRGVERATPRGTVL